MEVSFPSIDAAPSWYAITQNGIICLATFGCAVLWFLLSGNGKKRITDADDYTRYFLANSLAYFAGWNTMSIVRQLVAVLCLSWARGTMLLSTRRLMFSRSLFSARSLPTSSSCSSAQCSQPL